MDESARPDEVLLLAHVAWMRGIARALVSDAHAAEDLAQDAAVAALEGGPREPGRFRAWMRGVLVHRAADRSRSSRNRLARERASARDEAVTGELLERMETQRRVAELLIALDEPYRTALLLRYFEDLPPREIARRTGAELATVKSRLARGLQLLRERLDRRSGGDRRAWIAALAPIAHPSTPPPWTILIGMNLKLAVSVVALMAAGAWWISHDEHGAIVVPGTPELVAAGGPGPAQPPSEPPRGIVEPEPGTVGRAPTDVTSSPHSSSPSGRATQPSIRVRVVDGSARALSDHELTIAGSAIRVASDAHGFAAFELDADRARIESAESEWVTVRAAEWRRESDLELVVIVEPAIELAGMVVGDWGEPVAGARVELAPPADFPRRFSESLEATSVASFVATTGSDGVFALGRVPAIAEGRLRVTHADRAPLVVAAPETDDRALRLVLSAVPLQPGRALVGRVVRRDGAPATAARVALGLTLARTDERGSFVIDLARASNTERVVAVEEGSQPGMIERPARGWPGEVEIVLGEPTLAIEGRVVDARGAPKPGARVWIAEPTPFGVLGARPVRLEFLAAGAPMPEDALGTLAELPAADAEAAFHSARPAREPDALIAWVATDPDGHFEVRGLLDREYVLNVLDPKLHYGTITAPIAAGRRGVRIELPPEDVALHRSLKGRVVTRRGDPVPDVTILPFVSPVSAVERVFGGTVSVSRFFEGEAVRTRADGSFELVDVPRAHISFLLSGEHVGYEFGSVEDVVDPADHEVVVSARVRVEIELAEPSYADGARASDEAGAPVQFLDVRADGWSNHAELRLANGRSGVVVLPSDAATITLWRAGELVETIPVRLVPGTTTRIMR